MNLYYWHELSNIPHGFFFLLLRFPSGVSPYHAANYKISLANYSRLNRMFSSLAIEFSISTVPRLLIYYTDYWPTITKHFQVIPQHFFRHLSYLVQTSWMSSPQRYSAGNTKHLHSSFDEKEYSIKYFFFPYLLHKSFWHVATYPKKKHALPNAIIYYYREHFHQVYRLTDYISLFCMIELWFYLQ